MNSVGVVYVAYGDAARREARLAIKALEGGRAEIALSCMTDRALYDQPLTIQLTLPEGRPAAPSVVGPGGAEIPVRRSTAAGRAVLRFEAAPADGTYATRIGG